MAVDTTENIFKVRLAPAGAFGTDTVTFDVSPNISENRNVNYVSLEPIHAPGQIQVYKNTSSRNFQISDVKFISRTTEEADKNMDRLWALRSWCMPRFGNSTTLSLQQAGNRLSAKETNIVNQTKFDITKQRRGVGTRLGLQLLGAPPPILYLSAYSKDVGSKVVGQTVKNASKQPVNRWLVTQHINRVPVVIQQLTIPYPNDVDYITTTDGTPMPIIMNLDIALVETHSPDSYESFSLDDFRDGRLRGF